MPDFSVIVPLHNEAENIPILQQEIRESLQGMDYELILIDDGSTDGTAGNIRHDTSVRVIRFSRNCGQSAALLAGMRAARGTVLVLLDGDLQNDPRDIPRLLAEIKGGADLVCGYRAERRDSEVKKITSLIANAVRNRVIHDGIRDTGCTLKAMRRECASALVPFRGVHRFLPALIKNAGFRITEIPVNHRPRRYGVSKYGVGNRALQAAIDLLGVLWLQSRRIDVLRARDEK
jgi:dolichol-phosphate mannosyltransferase